MQEVRDLEGAAVVEGHPIEEQQVRGWRRADKLAGARPVEQEHCLGWLHQRMSGRSGGAADEP